MLTLTWIDGAAEAVTPHAPTGMAVSDSVPSPADIPFDAARRALLIPDLLNDRVLIRPVH